MRSVEDYVAMFAGEDAATIRNAIGAVDGIEPVDEEHDRRLRAIIEGLRRHLATAEGQESLF